MDSTNDLAISLQLNVDYDLTDESRTDQGRLVYEPVTNAKGTVTQRQWQTWDARAGLWWGTRRSVRVAGVLVKNRCVQATPCTWAQLLARFPNSGMHSVEGGVILKARPHAGFRGNVDRLVIGIAGAVTTFDFEPQAAAVSVVPAMPPDSVPADYLDSTRWVSGGNHRAGLILPDIVIIGFKRGTRKRNGRQRSTS